MILKKMKYICVQKRLQWFVFTKLHQLQLLKNKKKNHNNSMRWNMLNVKNTPNKRKHYSTFVVFVLFPHTLVGLPYSFLVYYFQFS